MYEKCRILGTFILVLTNIILMASLVFILNWKHSCNIEDTDFNYNDMKEAIQRTKSIVESSNMGRYRKKLSICIIILIIN